MAGADEIRTPPPTFWRMLPAEWRTVPTERTVLVVVRTVTTLSRLLDLVTLLERDPRIQLVFTCAQRDPARLQAGVVDALDDMGAPVLPWEQATSIHCDLVLAASENDALHELDAPIVLVPHGIGYQKFYPDRNVVAGMDPAKLSRDGRVVPSVIGLSHPEQLGRLTSACPDAAERAAVIGDPALDRMLVSRHRASAFREALGSADRSLVVLASTWGPDSLFGSAPDLAFRLVTELPVDEFAVCAVLHPGVTSAHGRWQVRGWLADAADCGVRLLGPESGWQAALSAASLVVSDAGSLSLYAAALRRPLLLGTGPSASTVPGSPMAALAAMAPWLDQDAPLADQVRAAIGGHDAARFEVAARQAVADPGAAAGVLRPLLYRLLRLPEPAGVAAFPPIAVPPARHTEVPAFVVGVDPGPPTRVHRFPAAAAGKPQLGLDFRHTVAHCTKANVLQLEAASVVYTRHDPGDFESWAEDALRSWPDARLAAAIPDRRTCLVRHRDGPIVRLSISDCAVDPLVLASLRYLRDVQEVELSASDAVAVGERVLMVGVEPIPSPARSIRSSADDRPGSPS